MAIKQIVTGDSSSPSGGTPAPSTTQQRLSHACEEVANQLGLAMKLSGEWREPEAADLIYKYMRDLFHEITEPPAPSADSPLPPAPNCPSCGVPLTRTIVTHAPADREGQSAEPLSDEDYETLRRIADKHGCNWLPGNQDILRETFLAGAASWMAEGDLATLLPNTFYADRPLADRVRLLVSAWQRAILANQEPENRMAEGGATGKGNFDDDRLSAE